MAVFNLFNNLPDVLKGAISGPLVTKDASNLSGSSKKLNFLLHRPPADLMMLRQFLHHVVRGERIEMQKMLGANSDLLWHRGVVTDYSGRQFGSISGFEYALWALDKHQWDDMLGCLPRDDRDQLTEHGRKVVQELLEQYEQIQTKGLSYRLNNMIKKESHYNFFIISALTEQLDAQKNYRNIGLDAIDGHWRQCVGNEQRLLPVHVVDEYCSNTPFSPLSQFNSQPLPANGLRQFYNYLSKSWESWFGREGNLTVLGNDFAVYGG